MKTSVVAIGIIVGAMTTCVINAKEVIPGRIELENYDEGGEGIAYHDDQVKHGSRGFRPDDFVDVEMSSDVDGDFYVGWTHAGEWLKYTVEVKSSGTYTPRFRIASVVPSPVVLEGRKLGETEFKEMSFIKIPNTGGIHSWKTITGPNVKLDAGTWELRIVMQRGGLNLNWLQFDSI